jgi:hypothetical protein
MTEPGSLKRAPSVALAGPVHEPLLSLTGVSHAFGSVEVLRGLDLEVRRGEFVALVQLFEDSLKVVSEHRAVGGLLLGIERQQRLKKALPKCRVSK